MSVDPLSELTDERKYRACIPQRQDQLDVDGSRREQPQLDETGVEALRRNMAGKGAPLTFT